MSSSEEVFRPVSSPGVGGALEEGNSTISPELHDMIVRTEEGNSTSSAKNVTKQESIVPDRPVERVIGIQFRAGNYSSDRWRDPIRHSRADLGEFLACAAQVERNLGYDPATTRWLLAADADTKDWPELSTLYNSGKLRGPHMGEHSNAVVHLDRSSLALLSVGLADVWAQWLVLGLGVDALVLAASGYGVTAGEVGFVKETWFAKGCVRADLAAS